jgi:hypothetical protein
MRSYSLSVHLCVYLTSIFFFSFSLRSVSFQRKVVGSSSKNFLFHQTHHCIDKEINIERRMLDSIFNESTSMQRKGSQPQDFTAL